MIKKLCIIMMIMTLSSIQLLDVQANSSILSQLPEAIQERLYDRLNNLEVANIDTKIITSDGEASDFLGTSIAIDGTTLVVGVHTDDDNGSNSGSVYVYDLTKKSGEDGFETKITASDGAADDFFGHSVAIDGTTLVVGAYDDANGENSGSVYVYDLTKTSSDTGFERKIIASDPAANYYFGWSVAIDGTTLVASSFSSDGNAENSGSVYVFDLTKTSADTGFERKITASDGASGDKFGRSISIDGTTLVVGAHFDDDNGLQSGSVYVYDLTKNSGDAGFERKITASDGSADDHFGLSVAIYGDTLVVGAWSNDANGINSGAVYVYDLTLDGNAETTGNPATPYVDGFETKITASDGAVTSANMRYYGKTEWIANPLFVYGASCKALIHPEERGGNHWDLHARPGVYTGPALNSNSPIHCSIWCDRYLDIDVGCMNIDERAVLARTSKDHPSHQPYNQTSAPVVIESDTSVWYDAHTRLHPKDVVRAGDDLIDELPCYAPPLWTSSMAPPLCEFSLGICSGVVRAGDLGSWLRMLTSNKHHHIRIDTKVGGYEHMIQRFRYSVVVHT